MIHNGPASPTVGCLPLDADDLGRLKDGSADIVEDAIERLLQKIEVAADDIRSDEDGGDIFVEVASVFSLEELPNEHILVETSGLDAANAHNDVSHGGHPIHLLSCSIAESTTGCGWMLFIIK
jgi:hypothetical protein